MPDQDTPLHPVPESRTVAKKQTRLSLVWIVPMVAALVGVWVAVAKIMSEGPTITIVFDSAEGLEAGKTKVHYNGVEVGTMTAIRLSDDHQRVISTVQMATKTEDFLVEDTRFWVVRPRISGANVTGLGTLISGAYIGMEIGSSRAHKRDFVALTAAPVVTGNVPGRYFVLKTPDLGSLDYGTPIYFRRLQVGEVSSYTLDKDGHSLTVKAFVNAPYDQYVTPETRFWHASGIDVALSASGLSVQTQSVLSILIGGIAFETPPSSAVLPPAEPDTVFTLFTDRTQAFKPPRGDPQTYGLVFKQSVRGLVRGASVEFEGIPIGDVADIRSQFDPKTYEFSVLVLVRVYPEMLGTGADMALADVRTATGEAIHQKRLDALTAHGLRSQLRTGSLITGGLYVALDFFPDAPAVTIDWTQNPVRLPTILGELEALEATVVKIIKKLDKLPVEAIGNDVAKVLVEFDQTLVGARRAIDDAGKAIEPNSPLRADLSNTLEEVSRAARALRVLMDYLERHPEALVRGKTGEAK